MNLASAYESIALAEEKFDVNELTLDGVNVWLPARDLFLRPFAEHRLRSYQAVLGRSSHTDPLDWTVIRHRGLQLEPEPVYRHRDVGRLAVFNKHAVRYPEQGLNDDVDVMVFHAFTDYGETVGGRVFNRVSDGLVELYPDKRRVLKVMRAVATAPLLPYHNPSHFYVEVGAGDAREAVEGENRLLTRMEQIVSWAGAEGIPYLYEREVFVDRLRTMLWRVENFRRLVGYVRPRAVALASFFNIERLAMIVACWREGVPVVDVEHGYMGPYSPHGRLGFVPSPEGVSTVPHWFWTWGEESRAFIQRSLPAGVTAHRAIVGGSTWQRARNMLVSSGQLAEERPAQLPHDYRARLERARTVVYLCWQPDMLVHDVEPHLLPRHFLEAAAAARDDVLFCVRLHPRSHHLIPQFEGLLRAAGVANWEVRHSTRYPLLDVLPLTDLLLTSYSTVAFEAHALGIPVAILDDFGAAMTADYLARGVFASATTASALAAHIASPPQPLATVDYLTQDPDAHLVAFDTVLGLRAPDSGRSPHPGPDHEPVAR